jgi:MoaA/NifB/PqqE/SkfB family radical SAM enzyme
MTGIGRRLFRGASAGMRLLSAHAFGGKVPLMVSYAVTRECNLRCKYCTQSLYDFPGRELDTAQSTKMIGEMARAGTHLLMFSGGEPLMREDMVALAGYAARCGLTVSMSSNGSLLPERRDILRHLDFVTISLDGLQPQHDAARGNGAFDQAVAGIQAARSAGVRVITTTTIGEHNIDSLGELIGFVTELGVIPRFQVETSIGPVEESLWDAEEIGERRRTLPERERILEALARVRELGERNGMNLLSDKALEYAANWPDFSRITLDKPSPNLPRIPCYAGRFHLYVTWTGLLYPCCGFLLSTQGLDAVRLGFGEAFAALRHPRCAGCMLIPIVELNRWLSLDPSSLTHAARLWLGGLSGNRAVPAPPRNPK